MERPYQLILDLWEANFDVDANALLVNGVVGLIARLNSMSGGHHMDAQFDRNWALAKRFPVQALYFVYNPWVDGQTNYDWMRAHLPADYGKRRIFVDIEVRYAGYPAATYARETAKFCALARAHNPVTRYSGGGFLDLLKPWPADEEYWWAAYPYGDESKGQVDLRRATTWEQYRLRIERLNYREWTRLCPGSARMWQSSGDGVRLPGFGNHAVDVNVFPGPLEDAEEWFGCDNRDNEEQPIMSIPIGLFTRKAGWTQINPAFNFVAGAAQVKDTVEPNPNIKPIELEAAANKIPHLLWWEHLPWTYSEEQWGEKNWPDEAHDYIWQNFRAILGARSYAAVVVSVNTYKQRNGKDEDPAYVAYSAKRFMDRVGAWLKANRPAIPLILGCSNDFIGKHAPDIANWAHIFYSLAIQPVAIKDSYPIDGAKPAYLGVSPECEWWRYYEMPVNDTALIVFRGANSFPATVNGMADWLNYDQPKPKPEPEPEPEPTGDYAAKADLDAAIARINVLEAFMRNVKAA